MFFPSTWNLESIQDLDDPELGGDEAEPHSRETQENILQRLKACSRVLYQTFFIVLAAMETPVFSSGSAEAAAHGFWRGPASTLHTCGPHHHCGISTHVVIQMHAIEETLGIPESLHWQPRLGHL